MDMKLLKDCPQHLSLLASWMLKTWGHYNPNGSLEGTEQKLKGHLNTDSLPLMYVALNDEVPIGICALRQTDGIQPQHTPWLGSLYVVPEFRRRGVGEVLMKTIEQKALSLGYEQLYLLAFDETIPQWYQRMGWAFIEMDSLNGHPVSVMMRRI
jgi:GNAT superfamily N-acetyltransferase